MRSKSAPAIGATSIGIAVQGSSRSPDWNGEKRAGDNLYSDSVVALDPDTGKLKWYFQFTPHDVHDWDSVQVPVLADMPFRGKQRKLMLWANRNGFFYVLDRITGEYLSARPFVKQTWAKEIDAKGRPVRIPDTSPTRAGIEIWPGVTGGQNWYSPSFNPRATSPVGARGLMQLMPDVGRAIARSRGIRNLETERLYDPGLNIQLGTIHLAGLFRGNREVVHILAAYNAGESRVTRWLKKAGASDPEMFTERIPYVETRDYVRSVVRNRAFYRILYDW